MALKDLLNAGLHIGDWWQVNDSIDKAEDYAKEGFNQGRTDVQNYADPYFNAGLEHLNQYNDMGEFGFSYDNYLNSPNYDWLKSEGMKGVNRTAAAGHALGSGNTLDALVRQNQNYAQSQYGNEFERQQSAYDSNKQYHQYPMGLGADAGRFAGQYLSDMAIGEAGALGSLEQARAKSLSNLLGSAGAGEEGDSIADTVVGAIEWAGNALGITGSDAIDWVSKTLGMSPEAVTGAIGGAGVGSATTMFGGGAATGMGTGAGAMAGGVNGSAAMGALPEGFGGTYTAGASGATAGVGATLAAASPLLAFGAIIAFDKLFGSEPKIGKTLDKIQNSADPLAYIDQLSGSEMGGLLARDSLIGDPNFAPSIGAKRGYLSSMIISTLPPEQIDQLKTRPDFESIANDLYSALSIGRGTHADVGEIGADPATAFAKLFPELGDLAASVQGLTVMNRMAHDYNNTEDLMGSITRSARKTYDAELAAARARLSVQFNAALDRVSIESLIARKQAEAGVV